MKCKICSSGTSSYYIGESPIAGYVCADLKESLRQPKFRLELLFCKECSLLFYKEIEEADKYLNILYSNHLSTFHKNIEFENYLNGFADKICNKTNTKFLNNILEIGCNDGHILNLFRNRKPDINLHGIEPSTQFGNIWAERNINVYNNYLNDTALSYFHNIKFDVIYFRHVFEHIFDPLSFFENVAKLSDSNTLIVIEVPYLKSVIQNSRIDNLGYSHANYFTLSSLGSLINKFGFDIIDYELVNMDGGSIVVYIKKADDLLFNNSTDKISTENINDFLQQIDILKKRYKNACSSYSKKELIGYGAGAKGQHLIHILGLDNYIDKVIDDTPEYNNKFIPGTNINILNPEQLSWDGVKAVTNLVPTHHKVIKNKIPGNIKFIDFINE